jgi:heme exporter protein A
MLERVGLTTRRRDLVRNYSRGMVQRLAIARALLHDPEILLLDEPDTGLDPQAAEMLHRLLSELSGRAGTERPRTILTVTHHLERGLAVADRVVILANGRVAYEGETASLTPDALRVLYDAHAGGGR